VCPLPPVFAPVKQLGDPLLHTFSLAITHPHPRTRAYAHTHTQTHTALPTTHHVQSLHLHLFPHCLGAGTCMGIRPGHHGPFTLRSIEHLQMLLPKPVRGLHERAPHAVPAKAWASYVCGNAVENGSGEQTSTRAPGWGKYPPVLSAGACTLLGYFGSPCYGHSGFSSCPWVSPVGLQRLTIV